MQDPAPGPVNNPPPRVQVACDCGWTDSFSRGYSGLVVECPRCGRMHRVAMFSGASADNQDEQDARRVMQKLLAQQQRETPAGQPGPVRVLFKPFFLASGAVCAAAVLVAALWARPFYPLGVVIIGGAASWPLGLFVAWLGQRRQQARLAKAQPEAR